MADVGTRLVEDVRDQLQVDEQWSVRGDRQFTWWGWRHAQRAWADPPFTDDRGEMQICRVSSETDFVATRDPQVIEFLQSLMTQATLSGLVLGDDGIFRMRCSVYVHEETFPWVSKLFAAATILQSSWVEQTAADLLRGAGVLPALSPHPDAGRKRSEVQILQRPPTERPWSWAFLAVPTGGRGAAP